jgi:YidC/Oxa1 family membrane protein insertase
MEKRVLLAVVLSFVVLYGYQAMFPPPPKPATPSGEAAPATPSAPPTQAPAAATPAAGSSTSAAQAPAAQAPSSSTAVAEQPAGAPVVAARAEQNITFENESVRAVFTTRGGALKSWRLKKYQDAAHQPLELVPNTVPPGTVRPFTLSVPDAAVSATLAQAQFKPSAESVHVSNGPATLVFEYQDAAGLAARKEFTFDPASPYVVDVTASVTQGGKDLVPTIEWGPGIGSGIAESTRTSGNQAPQPIFYRDGSVSRIANTEVSENAVQEGSIGFAGVDDHYFLAAAIPNGQPVHVQYRTLEVPLPQPAGTTAHFIDWSVRYNAAPSHARFFLGPKDFDVLAAVDRDLVRSIHFGHLAWLVVPLLRALKWIDGYVGNWGWSIIILTILINVAMFPLRHKSVVSMRRMQDLQPEVKAIQDRYANLKMTDPGKQKMNTELMSLYRERGVNPASGCVPMLLTLPVLFAFYSLLSVAIELRGAPFVGWIHDLSVHDPLFITPILMGITQFVQTKMTPTTADPMQQKMMMFMPLVMMSFFLWAPSGLVLYWTTSNLWAIGQQVLTNRLIGPPAVRTVRPPAERRVKNVGGGKTDQAVKERK